MHPYCFILSILFVREKLLFSEQSNYSYQTNLSAAPVMVLLIKKKLLLKIHKIKLFKDQAKYFAGIQNFFVQQIYLQDYRSYVSQFKKKTSATAT